MELWTGALSWWKCYWPDLKSAGLFRRNLFLNSHKNLNILTLTLTLWPINSGVLTSLLLPHLSSSLTDSLPSLNLLCRSKTDARFMQDGRKAVWSILYVSVAFFPSLKQNVIAYRSSKVSDCIFDIHYLWQSGFSRVYSNSFCSCSFKAEIIKIGQSSHKLCSNKILNFQESTTILKAHTKKVWKLIVCTSYISKRVRGLLIYRRYCRLLQKKLIFIQKDLDVSYQTPFFSAWEFLYFYEGLTINLLMTKRQVQELIKCLLTHH